MIGTLTPSSTGPEFRKELDTSSHCVHSQSRGRGLFSLQKKNCIVLDSGYQVMAGGTGAGVLSGSLQTRHFSAFQMLNCKHWVKDWVEISDRSRRRRVAPGEEGGSVEGEAWARKGPGCPCLPPCPAGGWGGMRIRACDEERQQAAPPCCGQSLPPGGALWEKLVQCSEGPGPGSGSGHWGLLCAALQT